MPREADSEESKSYTKRSRLGGNQSYTYRSRLGGEQKLYLEKQTQRRAKIIPREVDSEESKLFSSSS